MKRGVGLGLVAVLAAAAAAAGAANDRAVVVLLFDGFAPALVDALDTPGLDRMRREGVFTHHFEPAFPSISLINQVTISTGCWPEHHGIVTNVFLDPQRGRYDHDADADWLTSSAHRGQTAVRRGARSGARGWAGAHPATRGPQASVVEPARHHCREPVEPGDLARADEVVRLLELPDAQRPRLVVAYFCGPDDADHFTGLDSPGTGPAGGQSEGAGASLRAGIDAVGAPDGRTVV